MHMEMTSFFLLQKYACKSPLFELQFLFKKLLQNEAFLIKKKKLHILEGVLKTRDAVHRVNNGAWALHVNQYLTLIRLHCGQRASK